MTRGEINTLILSWLDDEKQGYFTAADVNQWINLAQRQVQMELLLAGNNWYERKVITPTVVYQQDYVFPNDFMILHRLELILSGTGISECRQPIFPMTINQQEEVTSGTPCNYYLNKDRFSLDPIPSQVWPMRLYYSPRVQDLTGDGDVPDVPEQFMEFLAILACFDGFIKDDRAPENLLAKKAKYEEMLRKMAVDRSQDVPRMVVLMDSQGPGECF